MPYRHETAAARSPSKYSRNQYHRRGAARRSGGWPAVIGWLQVLGVVSIVFGTSLTLITAIGMVRLRSLFSRMHAATKPQVLGLVSMCLGLALVMQNRQVTATAVLVVAMQFVVAPISAHMLGRAAYRLGRIDRAAIVVDEYAEDIARAAQRMAEQPEDTTVSQPAVSDGWLPARWPWSRPAGRD